MNTLLTAALNYTVLDWFIFPIEPRGKRPLTANGFKDASNAEDQIEAWWAKYPDANIGIDCGRSGIAVIDVDGIEAIERWNMIVDSVGMPFVRAAVALTGSGTGRHLVYRQRSDTAIRNTAGKLGKGIDTRGDGGYIVLAPSIHPSGNQYEWVEGYSPFDGMEEFPSQIAELLIEKPAPVPVVMPTVQKNINSERVLQRTFERVAGASEGSRNDTLNRAAFYLGGLVKQGKVSEGDARETLYVAARRAGLAERETIATIKSGMTAAYGA